jgi:hypothetical protein
VKGRQANPQARPGTLLNQCRLIKQRITNNSSNLSHWPTACGVSATYIKQRNTPQQNKRAARGILVFFQSCCTLLKIRHCCGACAGPAGRGCVKVAEPHLYRLTSCSNIHCNSILLPTSYQPTSLVCSVLSTLPALSKVPALSKQMKRGAPSTRAPSTHAHSSRPS